MHIREIFCVRTGRQGEIQKIYRAVKTVLNMNNNNTLNKKQRGDNGKCTQ